MEEALGTRLFERTNRITALTPAGKVLQKEAVATLMQMERSMLLTRRAGQGMTGALRIGFVASAVRHLLPEMVARFHFSCPEVVLELKEMTTARQVASLLEDTLDIGIAVLPVPEYAIPKLSCHPFFSCPLIAVLPSKHPAGTSGVLSLSALARSRGYCSQSRKGLVFIALLLKPAKRQDLFLRLFSEPCRWKR